MGELFQFIRQRGEALKVSANIVKETLNPKTKERVTALDCLIDLLENWGDVKVHEDVKDNGATFEKSWSDVKSGIVSKELQDLANVSLINEKKDDHLIVPKGYPFHKEEEISPESMEK